jgi:hypothetical protein
MSLEGLRSNWKKNNRKMYFEEKKCYLVDEICGLRKD